MSEMIAVLAGSFLGSAHCIGMCGGLAAAVGVTRAPLWHTLARHLVYTLGRICTYAFLGAVAGFAGLRLGHLESSLVAAQQVFSVLAGVIMIGIGLSILGLFPSRRRAGGSPVVLFAPIFAHFLNARGRIGCFAAGLATGFLPCGLVYAALALAVAQMDMSRGAALMACFGLGTAPTMIAIGCGGTLLSHGVRARVLQIAACLVILMGGMMIYRAIPRKEPACHTQRPKPSCPALASLDPPTTQRPSALKRRPVSPRVGATDDPIRHAGSSATTSVLASAYVAGSIAPPATLPPPATPAGPAVSPRPLARPAFRD